MFERHPQLLQEAVQRDFEVEVVREGESAGVVVRGVR